MSRAFAVRTMRARLLRDSFPRVQMFILVSLTGAVGFAASAAMLLAGIETMALRYTLAMGAAYLAFLALLWVWLHTSASDYLDVFPVDGSDGPARVPGAARNFWRRSWHPSTPDAFTMPALSNLHHLHQHNFHSHNFANNRKTTMSSSTAEPFYLRY